MAGYTSDQLIETLIHLWNESVPDRPLDFKTDHIIGWYLEYSWGAATPVENPLYISVIHTSHQKYWGNAGLDHMCLVLTARVTQQFMDAFRPSNLLTDGILWDTSLPRKFHIQNDQQAIDAEKKKLATTAEPPMFEPIETRSVARFPRSHRVSFVEIWNPERQLGYGWRCSCAKGLLCEMATDQAVLTNVSYRDIRNKAVANSMFSIAIVLYNRVLHRVTFVASVRTDWDGEIVREYMFTIPTGLGEQTRFYLDADWHVGIANPITDIMKIVGEESLFRTAEGNAIVQLSEEFRYGRYRAGICASKDHTYGTNDALLKYLRTGESVGNQVMINALCLMHKNMCIICADANELALIVPSDV